MRQENTTPKKLSKGDKVLISSIPITSSEFSNREYQGQLNQTGFIDHIYQHGERNILVRFPNLYYAINYFNQEHLTRL